MTSSRPVKPTESEMGILQILWDKGPSTVREVHEILERTKDAGYTTTLKLMQIMFEKGLLRRDDSSRTHIYEAAVPQELMQQQAVNKMIDNLFKGSPARLIMYALGHHRSGEEELEEIRKYLEKMAAGTDPVAVKKAKQK